MGRNQDGCLVCTIVKGAVVGIVLALLVRRLTSRSHEDERLDELEAEIRELSPRAQRRLVERVSEGVEADETDADEVIKPAPLPKPFPKLPPVVRKQLGCAIRCRSRCKSNWNCWFDCWRRCMSSGTGVRG
ncbi:MAG: hypothetical protein IH933_07780 [Euryarchaeota archaeon]|nr:hypothetical protein [Euryarchaeota archaeon]